MEFSKRQTEIRDASGAELFDVVVSMSGVACQGDLKQAVHGVGSKPEQLTLDELRLAMLNYLDLCNAEILAQDEDGFSDL